MTLGVRFFQHVVSIGDLYCVRSFSMESVCDSWDLYWTCHWNLWWNNNAQICHNDKWVSLCKIKKTRSAPKPLCPRCLRRTCPLQRMGCRSRLMTRIRKVESQWQGRRKTDDKGASNTSKKHIPFCCFFHGHPLQILLAAVAFMVALRLDV